MTMDISPFETLLSSLPQTTHLTFEVWAASGLLFSSEAEPGKVSISRERQDFSTLVLGRATFQHASANDHCEMFGIPLKSDGQIVGSLIAYSSNPDRKFQAKSIGSGKGSCAEGMKTLLTSLAELIEDRWIMQSEIEDMARELTQSFEDLYLYSRIATQIKTLRVSESMLKNLLTQLLQTMRVDLAFAKLQEAKDYNALVENPELSYKVSGLDSFLESLIDSIPPIAVSLEEDYFIVNDSKLTPGYEDLHPDPYRFLAVKVLHEDIFYGWIGLVSFNLDKNFRRSELRLLASVAEQLGVVIDNTKLYRELERFVIGVIESLVYAIEAKDSYTRGHSERVSRFSNLMAGRLNLDKRQEDSLGWAAILHDIGKIGISENLLNKGEALTDQEYEIIQKHSRKGFDILKPLEQLSDALPGILHHHERWDGGGYPQGLKGMEIPLLARIIAVADTFDALTSERPYRAARNQQEALAIMREVAGTQLDPDLVNLFLKIIGIGLGTEVNHDREDYRDAATFDQRSASGH
jgi:HD-GYP domain-containing protein (c-di-GMP phosphodiesterase class II)